MLPFISLFQQDETNLVGKNLTRTSPVLSINIQLHDKKGYRKPAPENCAHNSRQKHSLLNTENFLPYVLSLSCANRIVEAAEFGLCEMRPLHLEKYLRHPVEQEIGRYFKTEIPRNTIVEIGNHVSTWRLSSQLLFIKLIEILSSIDREWIVFTSHQDIEYLLNKMKLKLFHLTVDEIDCTDYYRNKKCKILFCHIPDNLSELRPGLTAKLFRLFLSDRVQNLADIRKMKSG